MEKLTLPQLQINTLNALMESALLIFMQTLFNEMQ